MRVKYIIVDQGGLDIPLVFSEILVHAEVARAYPGRVVSAGFVSFRASPDGDLTADAWGESISLNVASRPEDSGIITKLILPKGY
jgi:hypothetical protein